MPISGYLMSQPALAKKDVKGQEHKLIEGVLADFEGAATQGKDHAVKFNFIAWDDTAQELVDNYKEGDLLTCSADMLSRNGNMVLSINKIDRDNEISIQVSNVLRQWERGEVERIDMMLTASSVPDIEKAHTAERDAESQKKNLSKE